MYTFPSVRYILNTGRNSFAASASAFLASLDSLTVERVSVPEGPTCFYLKIFLELGVLLKIFMCCSVFLLIKRKLAPANHYYAGKEYM
jgi:hypothetical protein